MNHLLVYEARTNFLPNRHHERSVKCVVVDHFDKACEQHDRE